MSYRRLNARLRGGKEDASGIENAFEAEGRIVNPSFKPIVHQPHTDYAQEIQEIYSSNPKLGLTFERLNNHQRHAVFQSAPNTILAAMVGSGKTTVLIAKIFYLHFIQLVPFEQMVVLTFTNKAAREIKQRISSFLGNYSDDLNKHLRYFGTFHSVARQLIDEHELLPSIGYKQGFTILDEQDKQEFLERIISQNDLDVKYQNKLSKRWDNYKKSGTTLMGSMKLEDDLIKLIQMAETEKRRSNRMDFDDLLSIGNQLLKAQNANPPKWIIVDEFQDCNAIQLDLIENLKGKETNVFVVGDPNQSIYGWRGSDEHIFKQVQSRWNALWMELPQNYRSTASILSAAGNLLLEQNSSLIATRTAGTPISLIRHFSDQQEAFYLKEQLHELMNSNVALETVAVLFRTHEQIKLVENVLAQDNIPFQLGKRLELYDSPSQAFILRVFKLCCNPNDVDSCLAILCDSTFGIMKRSKKLLLSLRSDEKDISAVSTIIKELEKSKKKVGEHILLFKQIERFSHEFLELRNANSEQLIDYLQLRNILKPTSIHHKEYLIGIDEAWREVSRYMNEKGWGNRNEIFHVAIDQVVLEGTFHINGGTKGQGRGVHLLTIHAAKGLEFDRVYIAGANTGIIPLSQHRGSQNLKEEKRLLFVAITRGKDAVEIGWHAQPTFRNALPEPSYFLNAIPEALLERKAYSSPEKKNTETDNAGEWIVGTKVSHKKYGIGEIVEITDSDYICTFEKVGRKEFSKVFGKALLGNVEE